MKNKPLKHKNLNTFKFIPFSQRIQNVKVDVVHQVKHKYELETDETSYFYQAYEKWILLNCSQCFDDLKEAITEDIKTLPQLIARKEELIDILKHHLSLRNPLNLQALLEFVVALAKDLRQEFYPYFFSFYSDISKLLSVKDAEQLEWVFQCLAYLFKFLWRYLINNLGEVFKTLLPLFTESKPPYIRNFASQSFGYVARKVKDEHKLIKLVFRNLKEKPYATAGCSRLFFEIIRGIKGHFHSCGEKILNGLFLALEEDSYPHTIVCEVLTNVTSELLSFLSISEVPTFWKLLQASLKSFHEKCRNEPNEKNVANVDQILSMIKQCLEWKSCSILTDPNSLITQLLKLLEPQNQLTPELTDLISQILSYILLSSKALPQELSSRIVIGAMTHLNEKDLLTFSVRILNYSSFDGLVLPRLMSFCVEKSTPRTVLPYFSKIVLRKAPRASDTRQLVDWTPYSLNLSKKEDSFSFSTSCLKLISKSSREELLAGYEECLLILYVLPHILPVSKKDATSSVARIINLICDLDLEKMDNEDDTYKLLYLLSSALETLIYLKPDSCITKIVPPGKLLPVLLRFSDVRCIFILRSLDFYISLDELNDISEYCEDIKRRVSPLLMAPYDKARLHATHILYEVEKVQKNHEMASSVLEVCWLAECVPVTLHTYRDKLNLLQRLDCSNEIYSQALMNGALDSEVPLSYLFGVLFINFKLLWAPVSKIISSYGSTVSPTSFWDAFAKHFDELELVIRKAEITSAIDLHFSSEEITEEFQRVNTFKNTEKPDYLNCRILLLDILKDLPEIYESKRKPIVIHFLSFIEEEYRKKYPDAARTWNIKSKEPVANDTLDITEQLILNEEEMDIENETTEVKTINESTVSDMEVEDTGDKISKMDVSDDGNESNDQSKDLGTSISEAANTEGDLPVDDVEEIKRKFEEEKFPEEEWNTKKMTKTLVAYMAVFGKFKNPKTLYKEPELHLVFMDFLSHKFPEVQRGALDYIFSYNPKHLVPYKEHLYGLIDDKTFRKELSVFSIDSRSEVVLSEHRPLLIPIVLRIVHSRMYGKVSSSKGEKRVDRKAAVLRFISGCSAEELTNFILMAFNPFTEFVKDSYEEMVSEIVTSINLEECIPPRRMFTCSFLLHAIISKCGGVMSEEQSRLLLKLILIIASYPPAIMSKRDEVHPGYFNLLKGVRKLCFEALAQFFNMYEQLDWAEDETNALFKVFVWPYLDTFGDGLSSPSLLLKIFIIWSKNEKFFPFLERKNSNGSSPLSITMDLWLASKLHPVVHNFLIDFVHNILVPEDGAEDDVAGITLLSGYMPQILEILQNRLSSKKKLTKTELSVLSFVTTSAREYISSESLLAVILPSLLKGPKKDEVEINDLLKTVGNLIIKSKEPLKHLSKLVSLFSSLSTPGSRKLLLSTVLDISKDIKFPLDEELLHDLNAWDPKWVEQPDYGKRLDAYLQIEKMDGSVNSLMAVIIIRTSFLYLQEEKDLSLKESARHCLKTFCPKVCLHYSEKPKELNFIIDRTILLLVKKGLIDHSEVYRQECVSFFGFLVRESGSVHKELKSFIPFSNKIDLEVDCFENLVHLQLHRRVRAMLRFSEILDTMDVRPLGKSIMEFILPMISQFLLSFKYADKNTIVDSAIKAFGSICRALPWRYYRHVFKTYLEKLHTEFSFHKQVIRIISEILNAFHFDLSRAGEVVDNQLLPINNKEEEIINEDGLVDDEDDEKTDEAIAGEVTTEDLDKTDRDPVKKSREVFIDGITANRIIQELANVILPNLQKILSEKLTGDSFHKVNKRLAYAESDEDSLLRIPLAIAIVKLLQKLPSPKLLEDNLPRLFLKLANFLKSRSESVRKCTRSTLEAIMASLGPKYLPSLVSELCSLLTKGYQVHVLIYTIHGVLSHLKPQFQRGDIDPCIPQILSVCSLDLFGAISEEKDVGTIVSKTYEAKAKRSYNIFNILGTYCSEQFLLNIVLPLKEELHQTVSHKSITKVSDCLQQLTLGLTDNSSLPPESLLEFSYGLASESIPVLMAKEKRKLDPKLLEYQARRDPDIFIIPQKPKQQKSLVTLECAQTNANILVEFGLKLLYFLLKREKVNKSQFKPMLEPLATLLIDCLKSKHVKVSTLALKCFSWVLKMDLVSVNSNIKEISTLFFEILHKYAAAGLSKGDNFDLVMATFKAVGVLVRSVKAWESTPEDRRVLLLYCEQDLDDRERQATAFSLLKALIQKNVMASELHQVMRKVSNVSITSYLDSVRVQSRQVMLTYLLEYQLSKDDFVTFLSFYLSQLSYTTKIGRQSALAFVRSLISSAPQNILNEYSGVLFVNVATRLINEDESELKKEAAAVIGQMLLKLEQNGRDKLFGVTTAWIKSKKLLHRRLGLQLVGLFVTAEKSDFERRIDPFLKLVVKEFRAGFSNLKPGRFVLIKTLEEEEKKKEEDKDPKDQLAFHTLQSLIKVFTVFPEALKDNKFSEYIDVIRDESHSLLAHEHEWVRTQAVQVLGLILTSREETGTKALALDVVSQLLPTVSEQLLMQCMKLLVHMAVAVSKEEESNEFTLSWLIRKVRQAVNREVVYSQSSIQIRMMACKWGAALSLKLSKPVLERVAFDLLMPIIKEIESEKEELAKAAKSAGGYIKGKLGQSDYNNLVSRISQNIEAKKAIRKKERSQLAVTDPEKAAKRKINKQLKKKVLKKRKIDLMKNHQFKKKPKKEVDLEF